MDCTQALSLLTADLDREIPSEDRIVLHAHLADCETCRDAASSLSRQDAQLRQLLAPRRQVAESLAARIIGEIGRQPRYKKRSIPWLTVALSAAAGFLLAVVVFRPWEKANPPVPSPGNNPVAVKEPEQNDTMTLAVAKDAVEKLPAGDMVWQPVRQGENIEGGARVRTGKIGRCEFRTADGSVVRLNTETELVFTTTRHFQLEKGQFLAQVAEGPLPFQVEIPEATVTALGTQFDLARNSTGSILTVLEGVTKVAGKSRNQYVLTGESATIINGRVANKHQVHDLIQATSWVHEILKLKGPNNQELAGRIDDILAQIGQSKTEYLTEDMIKELGTHCVMPLSKFLQSGRSDADEYKRHRAARLLSEMAPDWAIPELINLLANKDPEVRRYAAQGLDRLTKKTFGCPSDDWQKLSWDKLEVTYQKWKLWWKENQAKYPAPP